MRILSLDYWPIFGSGNKFGKFSGDDCVFDCDFVLWDPLGSFQLYRDEFVGEKHGAPLLPEAYAADLRRHIVRRKEDFAEFVKRGGTLAVISRPPQTCYVRVPRNVVSFEPDEELNIISALPIKAPVFTARSGDRIEVVGDGPLQEHFRRFSNHLRYEATLSSKMGSVLGKIRGTDHVVSSVLEFEKAGRIVFLPATSFKMQNIPDYRCETEDWPEECVAYQESLIEAVSKLNAMLEVSMPRWAKSFGTHEQLKLRNQVHEHRLALTEAGKRLNTVIQNSVSADRWSQLFLGTGRVLELQVKSALEALGGIVSEPEHNRDDWRVAFPNEKVAVVEIKGISKSAAEKHAAQLEKWVNGEFLTTGQQHKGILIVNTWRE